jgi:ABC-type antimicrobial peptide transport system permease subunit
MQQTDPAILPTDIMPHKQLVYDQLLRERLLSTLGGFFAVVALLLAAIGLYGVLHYSVIQREKELGIRIALGAAAANIARVVTSRVMAMVCLGAVAGVVAGLVSVRFVQTLLYGVKGTDISMLLLPAAVLLTAVALAAIPVVLRAVRIDPARMLRAE